MSDLVKYFELMAEDGAEKIIISNPLKKTNEFNRIVVERQESGSRNADNEKITIVYQISKYTDKQVFHENIDQGEMAQRCAVLTEGSFRQVNGLTGEKEHIILISKKGACNYKVKRMASDKVKVTKETNVNHNRQKNYILQEGSHIEPLIDMGIFTSEGRVVNSMYDKYRQINRFIEIIDDEISKKNMTSINAIDFGCGKSYLTFIVYYYLTEIRGLKVHMVGLDLKAEVIKKCNEAAEKYKYEGLKFRLGDINGYKPDFEVDMVITLHACDTATDYALYNAISWKSSMIFSVPCCQHELNKQLQAENLKILSRYGIIKERFSALATDAIRANLLEYCGYKTQLLEFVDFEHTPKNIMIRAIYRPMVPKAVKEEKLQEVKALMKEFAFRPTLCSLLGIELE